MNLYMLYQIQMLVCVIIGKNGQLLTNAGTFVWEKTNFKSLK